MFEPRKQSTTIGILLNYMGSKVHKHIKRIRSIHIVLSEPYGT